MLIEIVDHNAELSVIELVDRLERDNLPGGVLHFQYSNLKRKPTQEQMLKALQPLLVSTEARIYFFENGDTMIAWETSQKAMLEELCNRLHETFTPKGVKHGAHTFHRYYDLPSQGVELRHVCKGKMSVWAMSPVARLHSPAEQASKFQTAAEKRKTRTTREILIVEDQKFYANLLLSMIGTTYSSHVSTSAEQAMIVYLAKAPDIVFVDSDLPGMSGFDMIEWIRKIDPHAFLVIISSNRELEELMRAKENEIKGFVLKPYNRQKIVDCLQKYEHERRKRDEG